MRTKKLKLHVREGATGCSTREFYDWFDCADWIKQETLAGKVVTIVAWNYEEKRV